jgi:hypothetical protein
MSLSRTPWTYKYDSDPEAAFQHVRDSAGESILQIIDGDQEAEVVARMFAASPELLAELKAADVIIRNALHIMTDKQKGAWAAANDKAGVLGPDGGTIRANARDLALEKAEGLA